MAVIAYGAWRYASERARRLLPSTAPTAYWLCEGCRSFNPDDATLCYRCHRSRPAQSPTVDATGPPPWDQRFGRPFGS